MTESANQLFSAFEALPVEDRHEFAVAVLRRVLEDAPPDISDEALVMAAEHLFLDLDAAEDEHDES